MTLPSEVVVTPVMPLPLVGVPTLRMPPPGVPPALVEFVGAVYTGVEVMPPPGAMSIVTPFAALPAVGVVVVFAPVLFAAAVGAEFAALVAVVAMVVLRRRMNSQRPTITIMSSSKMLPAHI